MTYKVVKVSLHDSSNEYWHSKPYLYALEDGVKQGWILIAAFFNPHNKYELWLTWSVF